LTHSQYLLPGKFIESNDPLIIEFAHNTIGGATDDVEKVLRLFYRIRDDILYDPYLPMGKPSSYSGWLVCAKVRSPDRMCPRYRHHGPARLCRCR